MNNLLAMRSELYHRKRPPSMGGGVSLNSGDKLSKQKIQHTIDEFDTALHQWPKDAVVKDVLLEVTYDTIVAKSNRLKRILMDNVNDRLHGVVGARFGLDSYGRPDHHILTYYVTRDAVIKSILDLKATLRFFEKCFGDREIGQNDYSLIGETYEIPSGMSKGKIKELLHDCLHVVSVGIPSFTNAIDDRCLVNIYPTELSAFDLVSSYSALEQRNAVVDDTTLFLDPNQLASLVERVPYLVTMTFADSYNVEQNLDDDWGEDFPIDLPEPSGEPTIGVIDTVIDPNFGMIGSWVDYRPMLPKDIRSMRSDYEHGMFVTSLVVAGHKINPELDDGCGWFKVRHFGVAQKIGNSTQRLIADIRKIVKENSDIRVWNLSLGIDQPISSNYISPLAACLDELQNEMDILFVVAGTNDKEHTRKKLLGSPGDSLNSLVVNSVRRDKSSASYSRRGPVLSFFNKPDVAYYGGDVKEKLRVLGIAGETKDCGTSLAAPWIARKASYLIDVMHLPREVAKSLLVDSALSWKTDNIKIGASTEMGYGVVPKRIEDVLASASDEIKFYISGIVNNFETYSIGFPVPLDKSKYPYSARAVLSYSPKCSKRQGVDYTNTELQLALGRFEKKKRKDNSEYVRINSINDKYTSSPDDYIPYEKAVREYKRKWDNVKVKSELFEQARGKNKLTDAGLWGVSLKKTERHNDGSGDGLSFGLVVTLKAIDGVNRIEDFIQQCVRAGWLVREIRQEEQLHVNQQSQERLALE